MPSFATLSTSEAPPPPPPQFQRYHESESDVTPPVKLEPCISASGSDVNKTEPLVSCACVYVCMCACVREGGMVMWSARVRVWHVGPLKWNNLIT